MSLVDEQWAIKLPQLRALERVHLFIKAVSLGEETLIIHASVGRHRRYSLFVGGRQFGEISTDKNASLQYKPIPSSRR